MFHRKTGPAKTFGLKFNLKCRIVLWIKLKSCLILHECLICSKIKFSSSKCETQLQRTWEILIYFFFYISDFIFKCNFTNRQTIKIKVLISFFTNLTRWEGRGIHRRNICRPRSCGVWGWSTGSRWEVSSSVSSLHLIWSPGLNPFLRPTLCQPPSSSTTIGGYRRELPGMRGFCSLESNCQDSSVAVSLWL